MRQLIAVARWYAMCFLLLAGLAVFAEYDTSLGIFIIACSLIMIPACGNKMEEAFA